MKCTRTQSFKSLATIHTYYAIVARPIRRHGCWVLRQGYPIPTQRMHNVLHGLKPQCTCHVFQESKISSLGEQVQWNVYNSFIVLSLTYTQSWLIYSFSERVVDFNDAQTKQYCNRFCCDVFLETTLFSQRIPATLPFQGLLVDFRELSNIGRMQRFFYCNFWVEFDASKLA